jgi:hypothetical protein
MADWTDESRAALIKAYLAEDPTPETSPEILDSLVEDFDCTVNGARIILSRAKVYVGKAKATTKTAAGSSEKKESKADSLARLTSAIEAQGIEADNTIISKLTGKAAAYFADTFEKALATDE